MDYTSDFDLDLAIGHLAEDELCGLIVDTKGRVTIEVKADVLAGRTGNVFIEYESRGKPSGLKATKAAWFALSFWDKEQAQSQFILLVSADRLRSLLRRLVREGRAVLKKGGDENSSSGVVVKLTTLVSNLLRHS